MLLIQYIVISYTDYTQYIFNQLCKCDDSLGYVGRPPALVNACKRFIAT